MRGDKEQAEAGGASRIRSEIEVAPQRRRVGGRGGRAGGWRHRCFADLVRGQGRAPAAPCQRARRSDGRQWSAAVVGGDGGGSSELADEGLPARACSRSEQLKLIGGPKVKTT